MSKAVRTEYSLTVSDNGTWVKGAFETERTANDKGMTNFRHTDTLSLSVFPQADGEHKVQVEIHTWVTPQLWADSVYGHYFLLNQDFTLSQLEMFIQTLELAVSKIKNGNLE